MDLQWYSFVRDYGTPQVYQGVGSVSMGIQLCAVRVTAISALCIVVHVTVMVCISFILAVDM